MNYTSIEIWNLIKAMATVTIALINLCYIFCAYFAFCSERHVSFSESNSFPLVSDS